MCMLIQFVCRRYGFPDPDLARAYDISVHIRMASVRYIHTNHFIQETLAFLQHFNQLQVVLGRMRAAKAGWRVAEDAQRGARIKLDIEAGAPIVLVPHSSLQTDVLCLDMGTLTVTNTFLFSGTPGTILYDKQQAQKEQKQRREEAASNPDPVPTASMADSMLMSQSIYGSLDTDFRSSELASPLETSSLIKDPTQDLLQFGSDVNGHANNNASVLTSLYSALGSSASEQASTSIHSSLHTEPFPEELHTSETKKEAEINEEEKEGHICLVDVMHVALVDIDVYSAEWTDTGVTKAQPGDLVFPSFLLQRQAGNMLQEKCKLTLQVQ